LALGQSIIDVGTEYELVALVTPEVAKSSKDSLKKIWKVIEIDHISCNHKHDLDSSKYDLQGSRYQQGLNRWATTCTKFAVWKLVEYDRVIFMDSDTLVVGPIDDAMFGYSNASLVAAPESFPPDMFNSGFMVISPSLQAFDRLLEINSATGSTEGGDQGIINKFCSHWFSANDDDPDCGRLPWLFNVQAAYYSQYKTLRLMNSLRTPSVIHFVSDGKPWKVIIESIWCVDINVQCLSCFRC
jgi:glycogenin glucosyltransferase